MTKKNYTQEETAQFKSERNAKRDNERIAKKNPEMVHVSVRTGTDKITGLPFRTKGKTFIGSIRNQFTGPRRNNFQTV